MTDVQYKAGDRVRRRSGCEIIWIDGEVTLVERASVTPRHWKVSWVDDSGDERFDYWFESYFELLDSPQETTTPELKKGDEVVLAGINPCGGWGTIEFVWGKSGVAQVFFPDGADGYSEADASIPVALSLLSKLTTTDSPLQLKSEEQRTDCYLDGHSICPDCKNDHDCDSEDPELAAEVTYCNSRPLKEPEGEERCIGIETPFGVARAHVSGEVGDETMAALSDIAQQASKHFSAKAAALPEKTLREKRDEYLSDLKAAQFAEVLQGLDRLDREHFDSKREQREGLIIQFGESPRTWVDVEKMLDDEDFLLFGDNT